MDPGQLSITLTTPERQLFATPARAVVLPGLRGQLEVLAGHAPLLVELQVGPLAVHHAQRASDHFAVTGGFAEVFADRVTVLAETAEAAAEIDVGRARAAAEQSRAVMAQAQPGSDDYRRAAERLARAEVRLAVAALAAP